MRLRWSSSQQRQTMGVPIAQHQAIQLKWSTSRSKGHVRIVIRLIESVGITRGRDGC